MNRGEVLAAIDVERDRQHAKWGGQHQWGRGDCAGDGFPEALKAAILMEEVGEVTRALLEGDRDGLADELVQVAAVAVAWREALP